MIPAFNRDLGCFFLLIQHYLRIPIAITDNNVKITNMYEIPNFFAKVLIDIQFSVSFFKKIFSLPSTLKY